jgi:mRNA interferase MazF
MVMVTAELVSRGEIFLVALTPTRGSEFRKTRPCVVVSPDELNAHLRTFIVAPLTTGGNPYLFVCDVGLMVKMVMLRLISYGL